MMKSVKYFIPMILTLIVTCQPNGDRADAYGNFEAIEVLVSSEIQGKILEFDPMEGDRLMDNQVVLLLDSTQLHLKKKQLRTGKASLQARINTLDAQIEAQQIQLENLVREKHRIDQLYDAGAATSKQRDDINGQVALLEAQILATGSQKASVHAERASLEVQIQQVEDQIGKCVVRNPLEGIILSKYKEKGEITIPGQSLYKLANLDELILRAYITGDQLSQIKIGGTVAVLFDTPEGLGQVTGEVTWISPQAEFTPKIIQTREERVSLVYAFKVRVPNNGELKIGMPGEVLFNLQAR
jgi:HlyD family secretion protein